MPDDELSFSTPPEPVVDPASEQLTLADTLEPAQPPADTAEQPLTDDGFIRLDRKQLAKEFARIQRDEPEVANVINSLVGQKARAKYQPTIDQLSQELEGIRYQQRSAQYSALTPEEVGQRVTTDPAFARDYATFRQQPTPQATNDILAVRRNVDQLFDSAVEAGLPIDRIEHYQQQIASGHYDRDASGNVLDVRDVVPILQRDLFTEVAKLSASSPTATAPSAVVPPPTPVSTPATAPAVVDSASPDLSSANRGMNGNSKFTWDEVQAMTPDEQLTYFPGERDIELAIKSGRITGISAESLEVYGLR